MEKSLRELNKEVDLMNKTIENKLSNMMKRNHYVDRVTVAKYGIMKHLDYLVDDSHIDVILAVISHGHKKHLDYILMEKSIGTYKIIDAILPYGYSDHLRYIIEISDSNICRRVLHFLTQYLQNERSNEYCKVVIDLISPSGWQERTKIYSLLIEMSSPRNNLIKYIFERWDLEDICNVVLLKCLDSMSNKMIPKEIFDKLLSHENDIIRHKAEKVLLDDNLKLLYETL